MAPTRKADDRIGIAELEPEEPAADAASRRKPERFTGRRHEVSTRAVLGFGGAGLGNARARHESSDHAHGSSETERTDEVRCQAGGGWKIEGLCPAGRAAGSSIVRQRGDTAASGTTAFMTPH